VILIDRSVPRSVARALQQVRDDVAWLDDVLPPATPDRDWLRHAGERGWLVVTRDKKIRTRPGERRSIEEAGVGAFVFEQKRDPSRWDYLKLLVTSLDEMERLFTETPKPFIFAITAAGALRQLR
jgi:hypothetical protein